MNKRALSLVSLTLMLMAPLAAQADDEAKFNLKQADRLHKFAKDAFKKGFPRQAKIIWLQAIKLYAPQHEDANTALGRVKVGKSWNPKKDFVYPKEDTGSGAQGKSLFKKYESLKKSLASAHRSRAEKWDKAGRKDKSMHHWRMVVRWVKDDAKAQAALNHKAVGAVTGTDLEQVLYDRSKMIEKAVVAQTKINYPVEEVADASNTYLDNAQVKYKTVKSEHFTLHSDHELPIMKEALIWGERAIRVMQVAFPKDGEWNSDPKRWIRELGYVIDKDTFKQILKANAQLVSDLEWRLEHTSSFTFVTESGALSGGASSNRQVLFDAVVRKVAQNYSGFTSDGISEGIGHTFVGMIFNNNRLFAVDLKKQQGTVASEEDREYTSPNFDIWKDLALEQAWKISGGTKASMLPLVKAATFTNQQRIKAWSFCDYMMRRDPKLLQSMDRMAGLKNSWDIEAAFKKKHEVTVPQLDKEWEDFWTGASPVMKAIKRNTPPLAAMSKGVKKWLKELNEFRKSKDTNPVTFSANYSSRCHDHAKYLLANKSERGIEAVQEQKPELEGGSHLGNMFSQMALVETKASPGKAKKIFERWMDLPGYRDVLVNNYLLSVGLYSEGGILVINAVSGLGAAKTNKGYKFYPNRKPVPAEVKVSRLGAELKKKLEEKGHGKAKVIGYPLTLHYGTGIGGNRTSYKCVVTSDRGEVAEGMLVMDDGKNRRTSAPGVVAFYPFKPLSKGPHTMVWSWEAGGEVKRHAIKFTAQ